MRESVCAAARGPRLPFHLLRHFFPLSLSRARVRDVHATDLHGEDVSVTAGSCISLVGCAISVEVSRYHACFHFCFRFVVETERRNSIIL